MRSIALLFFVLSVFSCSTEPEKVESVENSGSANAAPDKLVQANSMEFGKEWINQQTIEEMTIAHSGHHVSFTDSTFPYSLGLRRPLSEISSKKIVSVTINAWIYADVSVPLKNVSLVASLNKGEESIFWHGGPRAETMKGTGKWIFVTETIPFPSEQDANLVFTGYVLNNTNTKVLVDDLEFRFNEN